MIVDLHIHSYFSDGTQSPEEIVQAAKNVGCGLVSLCDHNTIAGNERFAAACKAHDLAYIPGVEISADYNGREFHILGYDCDPDNAAFLDLLRFSWDAKEDCSTRLIAAMSQDYPNITIDDYANFSRNPRNGAWKGIDYLLTKQMGTDLFELMEFYKKYKCLNPKLIYIKDVIAAVHNAGGRAILAHPVVGLPLPSAESFAHLDLLRTYGLDGIECYYPSQDSPYTRLLVEYCIDNNMLITAGCDAHGDFMKYAFGYEFDIGITKTPISLLNLRGLKNG